MTNSIHSDTLKLAIELMEKPSITPNDANCMKVIRERLNPIGFKSEVLRFGEVDNLWIRYGDKAPLFVFLGHTDVVPPGGLSEWISPPFEPTIRDGYLYGRGAVDMKGSIAAMLVAIERFIAKHPIFPGSIAMLLTSDEEGPAINGIQKAIKVLVNRNEKIDWCIVGEPSSLNKVGDMIRNGRRGSLSGDLTIQGMQGHVAYPHLAKNPIHLLAPVLTELVNTVWDEGNAYFPPTQFQVVHIEAGTGTYNVIPEKIFVKFNFRYNTEATAEMLQQRVIDLLQAHHLSFEINWRHSAEPFFTQPKLLLNKIEAAIFKITKTKPQLSTDGGTSDGRFIAPLGTEVVELGLCNQTIHQVNECVSIGDLDILTDIYYNVLEHLFFLQK